MALLKRYRVLRSPVSGGPAQAVSEFIQEYDAQTYVRLKLPSETDWRFWVECFTREVPALNSDPGGRPRAHSTPWGKPEGTLKSDLELAEGIIAEALQEQLGLGMALEM